MSATLKVDVREFNETLRQYAQLNKRTYRIIVDSKALQIAFEALKQTDKALVAQIRKELGRDNMIFKMATIYLKNKGQKITRESLRQACIKILNARKGSVGYLRSSWLPAIQALDKVVPRKEKPRGRPRSQIKKQAGGMSRTGGELHPRTEIFNAIFESNLAVKVGEKGMQKAVNTVVADMREYITRKQSEAATAAGVKHGTRN